MNVGKNITNILRELTEYFVPFWSIFILLYDHKKVSYQSQNLVAFNHILLETKVHSLNSTGGSIRMRFLALAIMTYLEHRNYNFSDSWGNHTFLFHWFAVLKPCIRSLKSQFHFAVYLILALWGKIILISVRKF